MTRSALSSPAARCRCRCYSSTGLTKVRSHRPALKGTPLPVTVAGLLGTERELGPAPSTTLPGSLSSTRKVLLGPKPSTVTAVPTRPSPANERAGKGASHPPAQAEPRAGRRLTPQTS